MITEDERRYRSLCVALQLCRAMASQPRSLYELANDVGLCHRTVRRVLTSLRRAGVDVRRRAGDGPAIRYSVDRVAWQALLDLPAD